MSQSISKKRCFNHGLREAVACCPDCTRFFCRECVTETRDKVVCSGCLANSMVSQKKDASYFSWLKKPFKASMGFLFMWFWFYYLGRILMAIPQSFHDGFLQ